MPDHPLAGSEKSLPAGARDLGEADPAERFEVAVLLRRRGADVLRARVERAARGDRSDGHLTREAFAEQFGADADDVAAVAAFARDADLAVVSQDLARRTVILSGSVARFNAAFGVSLRRIEHADGTFRGRTGAIHLPHDLAPRVEAVLGLDNRPQARPHFRLRQAVAAAQPTSYDPRAVASLYGFPAANGAGETVAIIELGGGYRPADLSTYFKAQAVHPAPKVTAVSVDHAHNAPTGSSNGPDGEVMLDIEVAGSVASGAHIVVYFAPNTDAGFVDAVTTAAHDVTHRPSVISISWGSAESGWTAQAITALDQALQAAATMGVTVTVASGDNGSSDGVTDGANHVDFPASSPWALGCGGTSLNAANGAIVSEAVWNDGAGGGAGGGGVSAVFPLPTWQSGLIATTAAGAKSPLNRRGVPDVSGDADPETGYNVRVDGADTVIGGTSAVAPLWAGLIALINQRRGSAVGYANPILYGVTGGFNDITSGENGAFEAAPGWDACTGLGSPKGAALLQALAAPSHPLPPLGEVPAQPG